MGELDILAVDIGGTNCRLAHFASAGGRLEMRGALRAPTAHMHDIDGLMRAFAEASFAVAPERAAAMVFAVAGPVCGQERITLTNAALDLDLTRLKGRFGVKRHILVNDFMAQALATCTSAVQGAEAIQAGAARPDAAAPRAVIGAGTGLGMAMLVPRASGRMEALPSEGGHAAFAFNPGPESEFHAFLIARGLNPYARLDDVLSGRGLSALHEFLSGRRLEPPEISAAHLGEGSETRIWFSRFYGRACRNAALTFLCRGGLYITGGIAAKNPCLARSPEFMEEFLAPPQYRALLSDMPVLLNCNEYSGLWGAAQAAQDLLAHEND